MADIRIEKKRKPIWPWLLGLVILLALGWGVFEAFDTDDMGQEAVVTQRETPVDTEEPEGFAFEGEDQQAPAEVEEYVNFAEEKDTMGLQHEYTSEGLNKLANALEAVSEEAQIQNEQMDQKISDIKSKSEFIQKDPESLKHADSVKAAFADATEAFNMLESEGADINVEELKSTNEEISKEEQTLNQKKNVKKFFDESASALEEYSKNMKATEEV